MVDSVRTSRWIHLALVFIILVLIQSDTVSTSSATNGEKTVGRRALRRDGPMGRGQSSKKADQLIATKKREDDVAEIDEHTKGEGTEEEEEVLMEDEEREEKEKEMLEEEEEAVLETAAEDEVDEGTEEKREEGPEHVSANEVEEGEEDTGMERTDAVEEEENQELEGPSVPDDADEEEEQNKEPEVPMVPDKYEEEEEKNAEADLEGPTTEDSDKDTTAASISTMLAKESIKEAESDSSEIPQEKAEGGGGEGKKTKVPHVNKASMEKSNEEIVFEQKERDEAKVANAHKKDVKVSDMHGPKDVIREEKDQEEDEAVDGRRKKAAAHAMAHTFTKGNAKDGEEEQQKEKDELDSVTSKPEDLTAEKEVAKEEQEEEEDSQQEEGNKQEDVVEEGREEVEQQQQEGTEVLSAQAQGHDAEHKQPDYTHSGRTEENGEGDESHASSSRAAGKSSAKGDSNEGKAVHPLSVTDLKAASSMAATDTDDGTITVSTDPDDAEEKRVKKEEKKAGVEKEKRGDGDTEGSGVDQKPSKDKTPKEKKAKQKKIREDNQKNNEESGHDEDAETQTAVAAPNTDSQAAATASEKTGNEQENGSNNSALFDAGKKKGTPPSGDSKGPSPTEEAEGDPKAPRTIEPLPASGPEDSQTSSINEGTHEPKRREGKKGKEAEEGTAAAAAGQETPAEGDGVQQAPSAGVTDPAEEEPSPNMPKPSNGDGDQQESPSGEADGQEIDSTKPSEGSLQQAPTAEGAGGEEGNTNEPPDGDGDRHGPPAGGAGDDEPTPKKPTSKGKDGAIDTNATAAREAGESASTPGATGANEAKPTTQEASGEGGGNAADQEAAAAARDPKKSDSTDNAKKPDEEKPTTQESPSNGGGDATEQDAAAAAAAGAGGGGQPGTSSDTAEAHEQKNYNEGEAGADPSTQDQDPEKKDLPKVTEEEDKNQPQEPEPPKDEKSPAVEEKHPKDHGTAPTTTEDSSATQTTSTAAAAAAHCDPEKKCHGHGTCDAHGQCRCDPPWSGTQCLHNNCLDVDDCGECNSMTVPDGSGELLGCYWQDGECRWDGVTMPDASKCQSRLWAAAWAYGQFVVLAFIILGIAGCLVARSWWIGSRESGTGFLPIPVGTSNFTGVGSRSGGEDWNWDPEEDNIELLGQDSHGANGTSIGSSRPEPYSDRPSGGQLGGSGGKGNGIYSLIRPPTIGESNKPAPPPSENFKQSIPNVPPIKRRDSGPPKELPAEDLFAELGMEAQPSFKGKSTDSNNSNSNSPPRGGRSSRLSAESSPMRTSQGGGGWIEDDDLDKLIDA